MKKIISLLCTLALAVAPAAAFAEGLGVSAAANATVAAPGVKTTVSADFGANAKARADKEITRRDTNISALETRVNAMTHLSADEKTSLQTSLANEVTTLTTLQAKIDADTDLPTLKTDVQSITKSYRVYMLILPQARIAASADRINTIAGQMQTLSAKIEVRIATSTNTSLQTAYTDLQAKIADATTQANAAVAATASLTPDNGDATVAASNTAALKSARAQIETATKDLVAARADIATILKGLKVSASATTTAP